MMRRLVALAAVVLAQMLTAVGVGAHESRPAYLSITEKAPGRYEILWRTPQLSGMPLPVRLALPEDARDVSEPSVRDLGDSLLHSRHIEIAGGIRGQRIDFVGLQGTITDVLVRVQLLDGATTTSLVRPPRPWVEIAAARGKGATALTFLAQGIEHILLGIDHLLFVFGLLLIVRSPWMLFKTITAFTVAHSITLALATFGVIHLPTLPLNAAIALSILFLGPEIVRTWRGQTSFTIRHPWVVAFAFGLLHGVGFASGLIDVGLPDNDVPLALLMFNLGVELGQLAFVAVILLLEWAFRTLQINWPASVRMLPAYTVGTLGAFWTFQRIAMML